jgi:tungstate transport system substrate-binding protein
MRQSPVLNLILTAALSLGACQSPPPSNLQSPASNFQPPASTLRLATTTSTADTGLLDAILPGFETQYNVDVEYVAVGTGQALAIAARGDADVVLVHARAREDEFIADGDGLNRFDVMYNDFVVVGPRDDPAGIAGLATAQEALARIAESRSPFASRGDDSGTHAKENSIWQKLNLEPSPDSGWYFSLGQGMGETLGFANEKLAYTLTDRGTWLFQQSNLPDLAIVVGGASIAENHDPTLLNPYGVIPINPAKHPGVNFQLATTFAEWLTSVETQQLIADYGQAEFGQPLFYPNSDLWKTAHP